MFTDELVDLILHVDIIPNAYIAISEINLNSALLQHIMHVFRLLRVEQDGIGLYFMLTTATTIRATSRRISIIPAATLCRRTNRTPILVLMIINTPIVLVVVPNKSTCHGRGLLSLADHRHSTRLHIID